MGDLYIYDKPNVIFGPIKLFSLMRLMVQQFIG